jgi:hypothetical protein
LHTAPLCCETLVDHAAHLVVNIAVLKTGAKAVSFVLQKLAALSDL